MVQRQGGQMVLEQIEDRKRAESCLSAEKRTLQMMADGAIGGGCIGD
jgi:hypothetical protein